MQDTVPLQKKEKTENNKPSVTAPNVKNSNTGIPETLQSRFEAVSKLSMDDVRVHYNSAAPKEFGALAYTQNTHIYMAPEQERHLGHELGHIVQQKQGRVKPTGYINRTVINDDAVMEREADLLSRQAIALRTVDLHAGKENGGMIDHLGSSCWNLQVRKQERQREGNYRRVFVHQPY